MNNVHSREIMNLLFRIATYTQNMSHNGSMAYKFGHTNTSLVSLSSTTSTRGGPGVTDVVDKTNFSHSWQKVEDFRATLGSFWQCQSNVPTHVSPSCPWIMTSILSFALYSMRIIFFKLVRSSSSVSSFLPLQNELIEFLGFQLASPQ